MEGESLKPPELLETIPDKEVNDERSFPFARQGKRTRSA
jgi:hypothetical protein